MNGRRGTLLLTAALAGLTALTQILTSSDSYGIFRDELYYLACGRHLGLGYVDQPPLIALLAWLSHSQLGDSLTGLRLLPALAHGATAFLVALMAKELGGDRFAQALAVVVTWLCPAYVGSFGYLSMNAFDVLISAGALWVVMRLLGTGEKRWWLVFGLLAGIGLQNKISVLFLGFGLVVGLLVARRFEHFRSRWFWLGGGLAFLVFLPHLVWQALNGWPTVEFIRNATAHKNLPLAPVEFLAAQVTMMNPLVVPLVVAGLGLLLVMRDGRPFRALGWAFLAILVLMISQRSKAYYFAPAFTLVFASGAVVVARLTAGEKWQGLRIVCLGLVVGSGLTLAPLAKPLLPVESYVRYAERLGMAPSTGERKELGRLPQFFADRLGWRELAQTVAEVYESLSPREQQRACVFGQNYGQAGAIDFYGPALGLPPAISGHNSYHLWGPGECTGEVMIVIGDEREDLIRVFEHVELGATYRCADCMPYESRKPIWIGRRTRLPMETLWPQVRSFG
jgi:4-amino-4-deoxy-L-arabinose transferase-like glycosyltransferase